MKYKTHIHSTVPCPDCTHPNHVKFYVLNLLSAGTCEHCEREVEFRQPSELRMQKMIPMAACGGRPGAGKVT